MSKSTITTTNAAAPRIPEPSLDLFDAENVIHHYETTHGSPLNTKEQQAIYAAFANNHAVARLGVMIKAYRNIIKNGYFGYPGLSADQADEIQKRTVTHKIHTASKQTMKDNLRELLTNESAITPLDQTVVWWKTNHEVLRKETLWEKLRKLIDETPDISAEERKKRLSNLQQLKKEWLSHQTIATIPSDLLNQHYEDFLLRLEKDIAQELNDKKIKSEAIRAHLNHLNDQIQQLKRQVIYSMLRRLQCAEYYANLNCDDLLLNMCDRIHEECGINLMHLGKIPRRRESLSPEIVAQFIKMLQNYCQEHPEDKMVAYSVKYLAANKQPERWKSINPDELSLMSAANNPAILHFVNLAHGLIARVSSPESLTAEMLQTHIMDDPKFVLNKLCDSLKLARAEYAAIMQRQAAGNSDPVGSMIYEYEKHYRHILEKISYTIDNAMRKQLNTLCGEILSDQRLDEEKVKNITLELSNAKLFHSKYQNLSFTNDCDVILMLAEHIKNLILQNKPITLNHCKNIYLLISSLSPKKMLPNQANQYAALLARLPDVCKKISGEPNHVILHFLTNYLEKPQLDTNQISIALARHEFIARAYDEPWENLFTQQDLAEGCDEKINWLGTYVRNVSLQLLKYSDKITLDNFDETESLALGEHLKNAMPQMNEKQRKKIIAIKYKFENETFNIINDLGLIKGHLYDARTRKININKLSLLKNKAELFFSDPRLSKQFFETLEKCCLELLKDYCLHVIQHQAGFDSKYMQQLHHCLNAGTMNQLVADDNIQQALESAIKSQDGSSDNMGRLLVGIIPADNVRNHEINIAVYAEKRLEYIKTSRAITPADYAFFAYYAHVPKIAKLMDNYKNSYRQFINFAAEQEWEADVARLVELFGNDEKLFQYRLKGVKKLFQLDSPRPMKYKNAKKILADLLQTINSSRLSGKNILRSHEHELDAMIQARKWSHLLELVVTECGSEKQQQQLHYKQIMDYLTKSKDFSRLWLGEHIRQNTKSEKPNMTERYFINHFGSEHTKPICDRLDQMIKELTKLTARSSNDTVMSKSDYDKIISMIRCIKPLAGFYATFGRNRGHLKVLNSLEALESSVSLHFELHSVIKRNSSLVRVNSNKSETLRFLISSMLESVKKIEHDNYLSPQNVDEYVAFCNTEILAKLGPVLKANKSPQNYLDLSELANLLPCFSSDKLRRQLFTAHQSTFNENPYWMSLINHIDDRSRIKLIEDSLPEAVPNVSNEFNQALSFAKNVCDLKHAINTAIKHQLFQEADIRLTNTQSQRMPDLLRSNNITDGELLKLWKVCASKLRKKNLSADSQLPFVQFMVKLLTCISNELFERSKENPALLSQYIEHFQQHLRGLDSSLARFSSSKATPSNSHTFSMWDKHRDPNRLLHPVLAINDKTRSIRLQQIIEDYLRYKKFSNEKLETFKQACNDPNYQEQQNIKNIKKIYGIKRPRDAHKIIVFMNLYRKLNAVLEGKSAFDSIETTVDEIMRTTMRAHTLTKTQYTNTMMELKALTGTPLRAKNDKTFEHANATMHL